MSGTVAATFYVESSAFKIHATTDANPGLTASTLCGLASMAVTATYATGARFHESEWCTRCLSAVSS